MKDYGRVRSTAKPEAMTIDEHSVWVNTDIEEISENIGEKNEFVGYEYNMMQYSKEEYIKLISDENSGLTAAVTENQLALCELYEMITEGV